MSFSRKTLAASLALLLGLALSACDSNPATGRQEISPAPQKSIHQEMEGSMLEAVVDGHPLTVTWEDNPSVSQLAEKCIQAPIQVDLETHGGFELVGPLGHKLESEDRSLTAITGDILLYQSSSIVFMIGTNRWAYTRLGRVSDQDMIVLEQALQTGGGNLEIRCSAPA